MKNYSVKIAVCALAGTFILSGVSPELVYATEKTAVADVQKTKGKQSGEVRTSAGFSVSGLQVKADTQNAAKEETTEDKTQKNEQDFTNLVIAQVNNYVNVRSMPSEEGEIVGKLYDNSVGEYIEEKDGWYKILSGKCEGYVKAEYCVTGEDAQELAKEVGTTYAVVDVTTLKVRKEASTESGVLGLLPLEEELVVEEDLDGWVKVEVEEGKGYVSKDFVTLRTDFVHAESKEEEQARLEKEASEREKARLAAQQAEAEKAAKQQQKKEQSKATIAVAQQTVATTQGSEMGKAVADFAVQFVGNSYVYGGTSLTNGADCSGFVLSVYANFGVGLPHSSAAQRSKGYDVGGIGNAQPGDIVCYSGHVGIYIGNGQIVHASSAKTGIKISNATYRNILSVRRIF